MRALILLLLGWSLPSWAVDPVLHAGEDSRLLLARAAAAADRDSAELTAYTFLELGLGKPAVLLGGGRVESCRGFPTTDLAVRDALDRADRAMAYVEMEKARAHLQVGQDAVRCLSVPVDPRRAAQLAFLRGVLADSDGEADTARLAFEEAQVLQPGMGWDMNFPPDAKPLFDEVTEARAALEPISIRLVPVPDDGQVWLDGERVALTDGKLSVTPGPHLIQMPGVQLITLYLQIRAPDDGVEPVLVVPAAMPMAGVRWVSDESLRPDLDLVLSTLYDPTSTVYISADGVLYSHVLGTEEWTELKMPSGFAGSGVGRIVAGRSLMWTGVAVGGGGLILAGTSYLQANTAARAGETAQAWSVYESEQARYDSAGDRMVIARWTLLGGVALGGSGLLLQIDGDKKKEARPVALVPAPGGAAVVVQGW